MGPNFEKTSSASARENISNPLEEEIRPETSMERSEMAEDEKPSVEETMEKLKEARTSFSLKKYARDSSWERIKSVLGGNVGKEHIDLEIEQMKEAYNRSLAEHMQTRLAEAENLPDEQKKALAEELFIFRQEEAGRLLDEKTKLKSEKKGSYALIKGVKNVGGWLVNNETGKKVMTGVGLAGTAIGGLSAIVRKAMVESPKIAMKMGAEEEGKVVKGLEKVAEIGKFITPMGVGKAAAGLVEKWQKSIQESHQEKKKDNFEKMSAEEQMMALMDFNKKSLDKLMGILSSKKAAMVVGGMASIVVFMMTMEAGEAVAAVKDGIGEFNFGGATEHLQNVSNSSGIKDAISEHAPFPRGVVTEEMMAERNLDARLEEEIEKIDPFKNNEIESQPDNMPVDRAMESAAKTAEAPVNLPVDSKAEVASKTVEPKIKVNDNIKSGSINFGSSNKMPEPESIPRTGTVRSVFEKQVPVSETVTQNGSMQPEASHQQPAPSRHLEEVRHDVVESNSTESTPKPANVHGDKHEFADKQPDPNKIPFNQHKGFEVGRIVPNVPGAENMTMAILKENPIFAEKITRVEEAAKVYFGEAGNSRPNERVSSFLTRLERMSKMQGVRPDDIFKRVI
ncbi:MAG TPA: hypothetical protein DIC35_01700 [Candidatus Moranbacteria bacterium]|nr:hypothetical protein [Candidatus Moranbacteria bacterium]